MGRALPDTHAAPFGVAYYAALHSAGFGPATVFPVALAVFAGASHARNGPALPVAGALLFFSLAWSLLRVGRRGGRSVWAAGLAVAAATVPPVWVHGLSGPVVLAFWPVLTGVLAFLFGLGLVRPEPRTAGDDPAVSTFSVFILLACALSGLPAWPVQGAAAALLITGSAFMGGHLLGAAAGAALAVAGLFTALARYPVVDTQAALLTLGYVLAGALAGYVRHLGRAVVAAIFGLGVFTYAVLLKVEFSPWNLLTAAGIAGLLLVAVPRRWLAALPQALAPEPEAPVPAGESAPPQDFGSDRSVARIRQMAYALREMNRTFDQVAAVSPVQALATSDMLDQAAGRVCRTCSLQHECWGRAASRTRELFTELWTEIDEHGAISTQPVPEDLKQHCIYPEQVLVTLNYVHGLHQSNRFWERRVQEGRALAGDYVRNVARMLERVADEAAGKVRPEGTPVFQVVSGVSRLPKRGGHISGDSFVATALSPDRYLLALSDGMGVGIGAAAESKQCVNLLQLLLQAGFSTEVAVDTLNSFLLLRTADESFATVDLALFDLGTGNGEFVKIGATPSFLKRGRDVTVIKSASVPVGIVTEVQVEPEFRHMRAGDMVVMITDGIWDLSQDAADKEAWIVSHLEREQSDDPGEVAEGLLARAMELTSDAGDDMTVLAARIDPIRGAGAHHDRRPAAGGGWAVLRRAPRRTKTSDVESEG